MSSQQTAPVFLNLFRIRFPVGAVTSILHRITGVALFLCLPFLVYLLDLSLSGEAGFARATTILQPAWVRLGSVLLVWSLSHHLLAGLRFLLIDIDVGVSRGPARHSAWTVNLLAIVLAVLWLGWIL